MSKSQRLIELMMTANRKRKFTAKELADEFGVSVRTILRDLRELEAIGFPLYSETGPGGGYRVLNDRQLPPISFMENEAVAMFFASRSLDFKQPFEGEIGSALNKFYHQLPNDAKKRIQELMNRVEFRVPKRTPPRCDLKLLLDASIRQDVLTIVYDAREGASVRNIQPIGIYTENGFWYCPAYCFDTREMRLFRADRILSAELAHDQSQALDLSKITLTNWREFSRQSGSKDRHHPFKALLSREGVWQIRSERWAAGALKIKPDGTGEIDATVPDSMLDYLASVFLGLGNAVLVLEPKSLVDNIRRRWSDLGRHYGFDSTYDQKTI